MKHCLLITLLITCFFGSIMFGATPIEYKKPVRVYFVHSPAGNLWYTKGPLGLTKWGKQEKASVWTLRKDAELAKAQMLGGRATNSEIKAFLLVPAYDNK